MTPSADSCVAMPTIAPCHTKMLHAFSLDAHCFQSNTPLISSTDKPAIPPATELIPNHGPAIHSPMVPSSTIMTNTSLLERAPNSRSYWRAWVRAIEMSDSFGGWSKYTTSGQRAQETRPGRKAPYAQVTQSSSKPVVANAMPAERALTFEDVRKQVLETMEECRADRMR